MTTTRPWLLSSLLLLGLLALPLVGVVPVHAEDDDEARAAPLSMRIYRVGALTQGRPWFLRAFAPIQEPPTHDGPADEAEGGIHPLGTSDELIEYLRNRVSPAFWEVTEGADMASLGERMILVRADGAVHADLARELAALERRHLQSITVDVQAVRLSPTQLAYLSLTRGGMQLDDEAVAALLANEDTVGPAARVTTENGMFAEVFGGTQRAYLRRHTAVIREGKTLEIPVAGVMNSGLAVAVEPIIHANGRTIRVDLHATLTDATAAREVKTEAGQRVQLPATPGLRVNTELLLSPARWGIAHGSGDGWSLLVRATPNRLAGMSRRADSILLDAPFDPRPGVMEVRDYDVASLSRAFRDVEGWGGFLYDTSWDGPAPGELGEPHPVIDGENIVELMMYAVGDSDTWEDPATIEYRNGQVIVRQTKPVLAAIDAWLDRLLRALPTTYATTVELIEVDPAEHKALLDPTQSNGWLVSTEERAALKAALTKETAFRLGTTRLTHVDGVRNTARNGRTLRYLSTYDTAAPRAATAVLPKTAEVLEGLEIDARVTASPGGEAALVTLRAMRTDARGRAPATIATTHGPIELPRLDTLRLRTTATVPIGETALAGVLPRGDTFVLVLVTVQAQPRGR